jgi:hypothetical protein
MAIAQQTRFQTEPGRLANSDVPILIGYAAFAMVLLVVIYFASMSSGTAPADFAVMTVFP